MKRTGKACIVTLAAAVIVMGSSFVLAGTFDVWDYRMKITFSGYDKSETLTNFPALVVLSTNIGGFSYTNFYSADGADLRFAGSNEITQLNYEIEQWDTNGNSYVWVQVPELAGTNDCIYAYWGRNTNAPAYTTNGATWAEGYAGVWHMSETNAQDSTANNNNGLAQDGVTQVTNGKVNGADYFDGTNDYVQVGDIGVTGDWTAEFWAKLDSVSLTLYFPIGLNDVGGYAGISMAFTGDKWGPWDGSSSVFGSVVEVGKWYHLTVTKSGSTYTLYFNGDYDGVGSLNDIDISNLKIGNRGDGAWDFYGSIDEVRISDSVRSSNWIWACWMNQGSNDVFMSYGTAAMLPTNLKVNALPASNLGLTSATLNGHMGHIGGAENPYLYFCRDYSDEGTTSTGDWGNVDYMGTNWGEGEVFSTNITGLFSGSNYSYRCYVTNSTGEDWSDDTQSFSTISPPAVTNTGATNIFRQAATLRGEITDTGVDTPQVWFYYWIDGNSTTSTVSMGLQSGVFSKQESGLTMATNYTYEILASNMAGAVWSGQKSFETLPFETGTNIWTGGGVTDDWFDHMNWSVGVPLAGDHVVITNVATEVLLTNSTPDLTSFTITNAALTFTNWTTTLTASNVTIQSGGEITLLGAFTESQMSNRVHIVCTSFMLASGGTINADGMGYADEQGPGKGTGSADAGSGGGYGGKGGSNYHDSVAVGSTYGSTNAPVGMGSGGGGYLGTGGGTGGGAIRIEADGSVTINSTITANGGNGSGSFGAGGSGGGIYITCETFGGTNGIVQANGGDTVNTSYPGGGGGGRIAVWYGVPESDRARILAGDMRRVSITNDHTVTEFEGLVSVTNGTGWANNSAELGTIVFLTLTPPSGTMFMCQ